MPFVRGLRGATTVDDNTRASILDATRELLLTLVKENNIAIEDIASIFFTATPDLNAEFPALAARELGWIKTPLLCATEIDVPGSTPRCIRVLMHVNTSKEQQELKHVYLRGAVSLRPDITTSGQHK
ncbi:MAG: chorismate mutase [Desulfotomaculales bacterium]